MNYRLEQFDRAKRFLNRIRQFYAGEGIPYEENKNHDDDVISFFIHCYHVKDWIITSNKIGPSKKEVENYINNNEALRICADICNGEKHYKLQRNSRTGKQPHMASRNYSATYYTPASGQPARIKGSYKILSKEHFFDALELAEACVELWDRFISEKIREHLTSCSSRRRTRRAVAEF